MRHERANLLKLLQRIDDADDRELEWIANESSENKVLRAQLTHLRQLGLVAFQIITSIQAVDPLLNIQVTARGSDFLQEDGGLTATLNVVTVRIDTEQFRQLLLARLNAESTDQEHRSDLVDKVRTLPAKAMEKLVEALLSKGVDFAIQSLPQLGTLLAQAAS